MGAKKNFLAALEGGRNEALKAILAGFLERAALDCRAGRWSFRLALTEADKGRAYALANFDRFAHCNALITHDLRAFVCDDVTGLIETLRIA